MNIDTGRIVSQEAVEKLLEEERVKYVPLTDAQARKYQKLSPSDRVGKYKVDMEKLRQKQIAKRRAANKRNKQTKKRS